MKTFAGGRIGEIIAIRMDKGEDVSQSIERVARERDVHTGVVLSGIGTLYEAQLHHITHTGFPPKNQFVTYKGPIELLSIDGIIADFVPTSTHASRSRTRRTWVTWSPGASSSTWRRSRLRGWRACG